MLKLAFLTNFQVKVMLLVQELHFEKYGSAAYKSEFPTIVALEYYLEGF